MQNAQFCRIFFFVVLNFFGSALDERSVFGENRSKKQNATASWKGTIVDAHSQFGCEITAEEISRIIKKNRIAHTLLAARGCQGEEPLDSQLRVLELVVGLKGLASFMISTKLAGMTRSGDPERGIEALLDADRSYFQKAAGFAEIIVQHAPHETPQLSYEGINLDLKSARIKQAIELVLRRKVPIVLHLELNDYEEDSKKILGQLKKLLKQNPMAQFVLIHMAQASVSEARDLIANYQNIHFLTSTADVWSPIGKVVRKRKNIVAQTGWINLFSDPPQDAPYKGWRKDYILTMKWREDWKRLIEKYPNRFIFAMENVFSTHWKRRYHKRLKIWRKAFSLLSEESARKVTCVNAKRLWRLAVNCFQLMRSTN